VYWDARAPPILHMLRHTGRDTQHGNHGKHYWSTDRVRRIIAARLVRVLKRGSVFEPLNSIIANDNGTTVYYRCRCVIM
jgi:hypothetical protein